MAHVVWVAGGRDYDQFSEMRTALDQFAGSVLITGAARGADLLAEDIWRRWQRPYIGIPAEWDMYGRAAGYRRNAEIARGRLIGQPDMLVAFPGGKGTGHAIDLAVQHDIEVWTP